MKSEFGVIQAPGRVALADEAAHRRGNHGVRQVDLELFRAAPATVDLGAREIELRQRCLALRVGVVPGLLGHELPVVEVFRALQIASASLRSASRWRIVAAETCRDASACFTCSRISRSSILASARRASPCRAGRSPTRDGR